MDFIAQEFKYIKTLTWAETKKLEEKNTSIQQLQEEISSLERTFQTREHIAGQLSVKYSELEKQRDEMEMEVGSFPSSVMSCTETTIFLSFCLHLKRDSCKRQNWCQSEW